MVRPHLVVLWVRKDVYTGYSGSKKKKRRQKKRWEDNNEKWTGSTLLAQLGQRKPVQGEKDLL